MALRNAFGAIALDLSLTQIQATDGSTTNPTLGQLLAGVDIATGIAHILKTDSQGRLKQSHGQPTPTSGSITTSTGTVSASMDGFSTATVYISGTHVGINLTFEQSPDSTDGSNGTWFPTLGCQLDANTIVSATGVITSNASRGWDITAPGAAYIRCRATAYTSGTGAIKITVSTSSIDPAPGINTHAVTGSGTFTTSGTVTSIGAPSTSAATSPGTLQNKVISLATTNSTLVKATVGKFMGIALANTTAATWEYLKLYNKATAPTVGTDTPQETIPLQPGFVTTVILPYGIQHATGLGYGITAGSADLDTTAVAAGDVVGVLLNV